MTARKSEMEQRNETKLVGAIGTILRRLDNFNIPSRAVPISQIPITLAR